MSARDQPLRGRLESCMESHEVRSSAQFFSSYTLLTSLAWLSDAAYVIPHTPMRRKSAASAPIRDHRAQQSARGLHRGRRCMDERQPPPAELRQERGPVVRLEATDVSTSDNPAARLLPQHRLAINYCS
jgi:hypothetical protein